MRKLKVWGGKIIAGAGQRRVLVAERTKKAAMALLNEHFLVSRYNFDGWWGETGNKDELSVANKPGVWVCVGSEFRERVAYAKAEKFMRGSK